MFRCRATEAVGQPLTHFIPNDYRAAPGGASGSPAGADEPVTHLIRSGNRGVRADGEEFPLEASVSRATVEGQKFYTVIVRDITERRRKEKQLRQQAALLDNAQDAIMVRDNEERITF